MAELSLQHIDKIYDNKVQAVFDFNLDVKDGTIIYKNQAFFEIFTIFYCLYSQNVV